MKRLIAILCVMLLLFSLAACRRNDYKNDNKKGNAKAPVTSTEAEGTTGEDKAFGIADTTANTDGQENDVPSKENTVANIIDEHKAELQEMVGEKGEVSADGGFIVLDLVDEAFDGMTDEQIAEYKSLLDRSLSEFDAVVAELKDDPECPDDFEGMRVNIKNSDGETIHTIEAKAE